LSPAQRHNAKVKPSQQLHDGTAVDAFNRLAEHRNEVKARLAIMGVRREAGRIVMSTGL
jgi:hypothetical protein